MKTKIALFIRKYSIEVRVRRKYTNRMFIKPRYRITYDIIRRYFQPAVERYVDYDKLRKRALKVVREYKYKILAELLMSDYSQRMFRAIIRDIKKTLAEIVASPSKLPDETFLKPREDPTLILYVDMFELYDTVQLRTVECDEDWIRYYVAKNGRTLYIADYYDNGAYIIHLGKTNDTIITVSEEGLYEIGELASKLLKSEHVDSEDKKKIAEIISETPVITCVI